MGKIKIGNLEIGNGKPKIMGIINSSPESFYKESISIDKKNISERAREMELEGADLIDIGGMSTAPYLDTLVSVNKEVERIQSAISAVKEVCTIPLSVDTPRANVAEVSIEMGVDLINDVTGLKYDEKMKSVIFSIFETIGILQESILLAKENGINEDKLIIDPLIGFFRTEGHNPFFTKISNRKWYERDLGIISNLKNLSILSKPICISVSRKSFIGYLFNLKRT